MHFAVALAFALVVALIVRWFVNRSMQQRQVSAGRRRLIYLGGGLAGGLLAFFALPPLTQAIWPFTDSADRMHVGLFLALAMVVLVWWLMQRTTLGFELRTVGANPNAARYAGVNITRNIILAMAISGALAGLAGTIEVLGVSSCRCLPLFFLQRIRMG